MKAFVMAAGYGTRLEPLTIAVPKPMVPIVNLPTMQHNLELLRKHKFWEVYANVHYHPEQIENYFSDGDKFGVNLSYSYEEKLLGTAGGVKKMAAVLTKVKETFLALSSDALTDINLGRLLAYHKKKKALATIALAAVEDVRQFGIVIQDQTGRIVGFQEKPQPAEAKSKLANAGVYIFEPEILRLIPDGPYDFGLQLFPKLVEEKAAVYGYPLVEYWSDVGGLDKYIQASYDAMQGRVQIRIPGRKVGRSTWLGERTRIAASARFEGSVIVGDRCVIGQDVYIKDAVIGDKCLIEDGAMITGSVIWSDTIIAHKAQVAKSVVGSWSHVGNEAVVGINSVIANRCLIRPSVVVPPETRLGPNSSR